MGTTTIVRSSQLPPGPQPPRRRNTLLLRVGCVCLLVGLGIGYMMGHQAWPKQLTYTGRLASICGGTTPKTLGPGQNCFAVTLDHGTQHKDSCYSGVGALSMPDLGPSFWSDHIAFPGGVPPKIGDHIRVTVVVVPNVSCTPVDLEILSAGSG